jgi:hypothetical protein
LEDAKAYSSSFGQFAFDDLPAGEYEVSSVTNEKAGIFAGESITINLADAKDMMMRISLPVRRRDKVIRNAEVIISDIDTPNIQGPEPPPDEPDTMELARDGPAPP